MKKSDLIKHYQTIRSASIQMCSTLEPEQCRIQPSPEVSPPWWNLAHTSWFFVRQVIEPFGGDLTHEDKLFDYVLNSYYVALGPRLNRSHRGLMTRPTMKEVYLYRDSVDARVEKLINQLDPKNLEKCSAVIFLGLQHEQQHQELFYTEIKSILFQNLPELRIPLVEKTIFNTSNEILPSQFIPINGGLFEFGHVGHGWAWDNELPSHQYFLEDYALQNRVITNGEYLEFMEDGGYKNPLLWLDNGWNKGQNENWQSPLYWEQSDGNWRIWKLTGMESLDPNEPVCHVSFYEADAFARWKGKRLPTEREWEHAARINHLSTNEGHFIDQKILHPSKAPIKKGLTQMLGDVWEWSESYFEPYPRYQPFKGDLREYNEKFMDNQRIMRGGSCVSERDHIRLTYRNFWPPETKFQFTGFRLAENG